MVFIKQEKQHLKTAWLSNHQDPGVNFSLGSEGNNSLFFLLVWTISWIWSL